jgi:hypothetical protein
MSSDDLLPPNFVQGVVSYLDRDPTQRHSRINVPARFDSILTNAVVDTGAPWCILSPDEALELGISSADGDEWVSEFWLRGYRVSGRLHRLPVTLEATAGNSITVDATVFVPELGPEQEWYVPNFLGLSGFLERIRFAVDPVNNLFYFGAIPDR